MKKHNKIWLTLIVLGILLVIGYFVINRGHDYFMKKVYPIDYSEYVEQEAFKNNLEPELIFAVIKVESNFQSDAKSNAGACGLMQLMPSTFEWMQTKIKSDMTLNNDDLFNPKINIQYGTKYLALMLKEFKNQKTAICAYNAGIGTVKNWLKNPEISKDGVTLNKVPYPETQKYADAVLKNYKIYIKLYQSKYGGNKNGEKR